MRSTIKASGLLSFLAAAALAAPALADPPDRQCVQSAVGEYVMCKSICRETFLAEKDDCRNIDHDCANACRLGLETCLDGPDGPLSTLEMCRMRCQDTLDTARSRCRMDFPNDPAGLDACIDQAQLEAHGCRDACRVGVAAAVRVCRLAFRTCIMACLPPPTAN